MCVCGKCKCNCIMIIITPNCNIHDSTLGFPVSWALETIRVHSVVYQPQPSLGRLGIIWGWKPHLSHHCRAYRAITPISYIYLERFVSFR